MIGHDADLAPSGAQQAAYTLKESIDLRIDLTNQERIKRMAQSVELTALGPTTTVAADGHLRLILVKNFDTGTRHCVPQARGVCRLAAKSNDGGKILCVRF